MRRLRLREPRIGRLHLLPDLVRDRDRVAVEIEAERGHQVRLRADAERRADRLAGQHVGAVELAGDHAIEQDLPVGLRFERDVEILLLEEAELLRDHERRAVGELDEAELQLVLLRRRRPRRRRGSAARSRSTPPRLRHVRRMRHPRKTKASGRARSLRARSDAVVRTFECRSCVGARHILIQFACQARRARPRCGSGTVEPGSVSRCLPRGQRAARSRVSCPCVAPPRARRAARAARAMSKPAR